MSTRILVIVFDALRPEFVTPDLMPRLSAFAKRGVRYLNSRSTFLTETRVNQSAVTSGVMPAKHGLVANIFVAPDVSPDTALNTGKDEDLEQAFGRAGGRLLDVLTLGQLLAQAGKTYATLSAGTSGGGRLINHSAETDGTFRFAMRRPEAGNPAGIAEKISERLGPLPDYHLPAIDWIRYAADIYLEVMEKDVAADVSLVWLCEPDESFHHLGIGSPGARETIHHVDQQFGRILDHHSDAIVSGDLQVIAMSDHGQITLRGEAIDITDELREAGFRAGKRFDGKTDLIFAGSNAGGIWVKDNDPVLIERVTAWLLEQAWCGPIFTRGGTLGTLRLADVFLDHSRAPDIALVMRNDGAANPYGLAGETVHASAYPVGGGSHGGLNAHELHNVITLGGRAFKSGVAIEAHAGNIDITPTILALLGIDPPAHADGRVLTEAFTNGPDPVGLRSETTTQTSTNASGPKTHLTITRIATTPYLDRAWTE
jgi:phosphonoacetate hydrolase